MSRQYEWQKAQKAKGLCISCAQPAVNKSFCERHRQMTRDREKRIYHEGKWLSMKEKRMARRLSGLCTWCNEISGERSLCQRHAEMARARARRRREKERATCQTTGISESKS